jgi:putative copper resistance protein D
VEPIDILSVVVRAAALVAALQSAGLAWFAMPRGGSAMAASDRSSGRTSRHSAAVAAASVQGALRASALVALVLVLTHRGLDAARLAGEWSGILDAHLQMLVWRRNPGLSSTLCAVGLIAVLVGSAHPKRWPGRWAVYLGSTGAFAIVASFALTGHTRQAAHAGIARVLLSLHVGIVAYWIGAVVGLYWLTRQSEPRDVARAAGQFSRTAVWLVPLILPAGLALGWTLLPDLAALRTIYGAFLLAKFLGFCVLIVLAAANRLRYVPALAQGTASGTRAFERVLIAEYATLASVLAATAVMTSLFSWH